MKAPKSSFTTVSCRLSTQPAVCGPMIIASANCASSAATRWIHMLGRKLTIRFLRKRRMSSPRDIARSSPAPVGKITSFTTPRFTKAPARCATSACSRSLGPLPAIQSSAIPSRPASPSHLLNCITPYADTLSPRTGSSTILFLPFWKDHVVSSPGTDVAFFCGKNCVYIIGRKVLESGENARHDWGKKPDCRGWGPLT